MTEVLIGRTEQHLCNAVHAESLGARIHLGVVEPFLALKRDADTAGFDLRIFSGFRSFDRQLSIWNRKVRGELPVLDSKAMPLAIDVLSERDLTFAILRWSALPGASRHHWGTDLDIFDDTARPDDYEVQLKPGEVADGGMFGPLHRWLDERIETGNSYGFVRPYDMDRQGVAPERWHISYAPLAARYLKELTIETLREAIVEAEMMLKDTVLRHLPEIHGRFVTNVNPSLQ